MLFSSSIMVHITTCLQELIPFVHLNMSFLTVRICKFSHNGGTSFQNIEKGILPLVSLPSIVHQALRV